MTSDEKGIIALCKVEIRAAELGFTTSRTVSAARYDLVVDEGDALKRVQVKYADGKAGHSSASVRLELRRRNKVYSSREIDYILVYVPAIEEVLKLPPLLWDGKSSIYLRIREAKNNQQQRAIPASQYVW